ncbi:hypothetical protein AHF37_08030 [Paragonimus kellicotti]|nr:hypothetical protein AHF37_08030 [Paragonimus kellicotti]
MMSCECFEWRLEGVTFEEIVYNMRSTAGIREEKSGLCSVQTVPPFSVCTLLGGAGELKVGITPEYDVSSVWQYGVAGLRSFSIPPLSMYHTRTDVSVYLTVAWFTLTGQCRLA